MNISVISFVRHFNSTPLRTAATYLLKKSIKAQKSKSEDEQFSTKPFSGAQTQEDVIVG